MTIEALVPARRRRGAPIGGCQQSATAFQLAGTPIDDGAVAFLYTYYHPRIVSLARSQVMDPAAAEDFASDVMLKVLESMGKYKPIGIPFSAWVYRIAHNRLIDSRRQRRITLELDALGILGDDAGDPQTKVGRIVARDQLLQAMENLTNVQREVILLKFIAGYDTASIAALLGRRPGAVKSIQHRALAGLRRALETMPGMVADHLSGGSPAYA